MIYQFLDWRIGLQRRMYVIQVENLLKRLRDLDGGSLPYFLKRWDHYLAFAGESGIMLPENKRVAESIDFNNDFPSIEWLKNQYTKFLEHMNQHAPEMLTDPPIPVKSAPEALKTEEKPLPPTTVGQTFSTIVEGSVSNVTPKEGGEECSDQNLVTSSHSSMLADSPNALSIKKNPSQLTRSLTPTPAL